MGGISAIGCYGPVKKKYVLNKNAQRTDNRTGLANDVFKKQNNVSFGSVEDSEIFRRLQHLGKKEAKKAWKNYTQTKKATEGLEKTGRTTKKNKERIDQLRGQSIAAVVRAIEQEVKGV